MEAIVKIQPQIKAEVINWHNKSLSYIKANFGCFNVPLSAKLIIINGRLFVNNDEKIFKTQIQSFNFKNYGITDFSSIVQRLIIAVHSKYEKKLRMGGRNFNFTIIYDLLTIKVGLTNELKYDISLFFNCKISRKNRILRVQSIFLENLNTLAAHIRVGFKRNAYTGKGVRYKGEMRITKIMHKTRR